MIVEKGAYVHSRLILKNPAKEIIEFQKMVPTPDGFDKYAPKRQWEYLAGRMVANEALSELGIDNYFPTKKESGAAQWPDGIIGSITHSHGIAEAVVTKSESLQFLGVDVEKIIVEKQLELTKRIFIEGNFEALKAKTDLSDVKLFSVVFSAKECLYKALYEHVGEYFGFHKAKVVSITDTDLEIEVQEDLSDRVKKGFRLTCKYEFDLGFVRTLIVE